MPKLNIALPDTLNRYLQNQVSSGGYESASEYLRQLIREDQKRRAADWLESEILKGLRGGPATPMTAADWQALREEIRRPRGKRTARTANSRSTAKK